MSFWVRRDDVLMGRLLDEGRDFLRIEDLAGRDIAIPGSGFKCFEQLKRVAGERGVELGRLIELSEIFQLYGYAVEGRALGFANGTLIDLPVFRRDDAVVPLPVEGLSFGFCIERLATHALGEAEQAFWNWCVAAARDLPGNRLGH